MPVAHIWTEALSNAGVCSPRAAKRAIETISQSAGVALREALVLFAIYNSGRSQPHIGKLERMTNVNASSQFYVVDSLSAKGLARVSRRDGYYVFVELTDKGDALMRRCLS